MAKTYFVVRATVADPADRPGFDAWYRDEHLPDAIKAFGSRHAWRAWSRSDPAVHCAFYEFPDAAAAEAMMASPVLKAMVAEFDRAWGARVVRSRELLEVAGELGAG